MQDTACGDCAVPYAVLERVEIDLTSNREPVYIRLCVVYKKLSYCWETVRRESMPRIAKMDVEMTT